jgi:glycosyltransferase involved in cell wall biosynthesis
METASKHDNLIDYSIIVPVYFNEGSIVKTIDLINNTVIARNSLLIPEIIIVDDGSLDNSFKEIMLAKEQHNELLKVIKLTRNFGQLSAILAGYSIARGKCIINISADLQDPPELINQMLDAYFKESYEIVICTREQRDETGYRKATSKFFYKMIQKLNFANMPMGGFDIALISTRIKDYILNNQEANAFWQGQILWTGLPIKFIPYTRRKREVGKSRWTFSKKMKLLIDGVMSYSFFPIRLMIVAGIIISLSGFIYAISITIAWFFGDVPFTGWAPIMILILILSGFQMLMLGIIGEYLWRALDQVRNRPSYIIDKIYE